MEEEKKVITPPWSLRIHLFLLFAYTLFRANYLVQQISVFHNDALEGDLPLMFKLIYWGLDFLFYWYILVAICRTLKRNNDAVSMLRFSVVYLLCQTLVLSMNNYYAWQFLGYMPIALWLVLFLFFLARSKKLKNYIPERKFGKYGFLGSLVFIGCVLLFSIQAYGSHKLDNESKYVNPGVTRLLQGECENGYFAFMPYDTWKKDTILPNTDKSLTYIYDDTISKDRVLINGMVEEVRSRVDYYQILHYISKRMFKDVQYVNELSCTEQDMPQGRLYSNAFVVTTAKDTATWTIGMYVASASHKLCIVSIDGKEDKSSEVYDFCKSVDFNLKQRLTEKQSVDQVED